MVFGWYGLYGMVLVHFTFFVLYGLYESDLVCNICIFETMRCLCICGDYRTYEISLVEYFTLVHLLIISHTVLFILRILVSPTQSWDNIFRHSFSSTIYYLSNEIYLLYKLNSSQNLLISLSDILYFTVISLYNFNSFP